MISHNSDRRNESVRAGKSKSIGTSRSGYIGTFDLIVAMVMFLSVIYLVLWASNETQTTVQSFGTFQSYKDKALNVLDTLLETEGNPPHWENLQNISADAKSIGLVSEPEILDTQKVQHFRAMSTSSYEKTKKMIGLSKEDYNVEILNKHNTSLYSFGVEGKTIASIERLALLEGEVVTFKLSLS